MDLVNKVAVPENGLINYDIKIKSDKSTSKKTDIHKEKNILVFGKDNLDNKLLGLCSQNNMKDSVQTAYLFVITETADDFVNRLSCNKKNSDTVEQITKVLTKGGLDEKSANELLKTGISIENAEKLVKDSTHLYLLKYIPELPSSWKIHPINGNITQPNPSTLISRTEAVEKALVKYPEKILKDNLKNVFLGEKMEFYGATFGGTNSSDSLYLINADESTVHHEFSSILLRNYSSQLDTNAWKNINIEEYNDSTGGAEAIKEGKAGLDFDEVLMEKGFLTQYSSTTMENDLNVLSENLFCGNKELWKAAERHPKIQQKLDLTLNFYQKIDPSFTKDYFRKFASK